METVVMPRRLTDGKGVEELFLGEFTVSIKASCPDCCGDGCKLCSDIGTVTVKQDIPWTTIKAIYHLAVEHFGENTILLDD